MDPQYYLTLGDEAFRAREYEKALENYDLVLKESPDNKVALNNKGLVLVKLGRKAEAMDAYVRALHKDSNYSVPRKNLQRLIQKMEQEYSEDDDFKDAEGHFSRGDFLEAISAYEIVLGRYPRFLLAMNNKGLAHMAILEIDTAIDCFINALETGFHYVPARENIESAFEKKKEMFVDHVNEGNQAFQDRNLELALKSYEKAVSLNPGSSNVWTNLGMVYMNMSLPEEAISCFKRALSLDPGNNVAINHLKTVNLEVQETIETVHIRCPKCKDIFDLKIDKDYPINTTCSHCGLKGFYAGIIE